MKYRLELGMAKLRLEGPVTRRTALILERQGDSYNVDLQSGKRSNITSCNLSFSELFNPRSTLRLFQEVQKTILKFWL